MKNNRDVNWGGMSFDLGEKISDDSLRDWRFQIQKDLCHRGEQVTPVLEVGTSRSGTAYRIWHVNETTLLYDAMREKEGDPVRAFGDFDKMEQNIPLYESLVGYRLKASPIKLKMFV